jgi:hypothetical protein
MAGKIEENHSKVHILVFEDIVTDLIELPGNRSVNTVQHAIIEETVFSVSAVTSHNSVQRPRDVFSVCPCPFRGCIRE